jgi:serine/threonine-protein kinase
VVPPATTARIRLPDRYRIVRHLANGGMASVWEAHDELLDRSVAVKLLASHLSEDDRYRRRFQREARAAAGLSSHPHVVTIYDVGEHAGRVFMVMELMRGGSVSDVLKSGDDIPYATVLRWLREAASALDAAHDAGVVHRDVKPANLLLDERERLAIADFGIAHIAMEDQLTATGQVLGTAAYVSPEQAMGESAGPASDRYALAVVAFELLTGERPFRGEHFAAQARAHVEEPPPAASSRRPELPRAVDGVLQRGMAKEPEARWPKAGALAEALEDALDEPAPPPTAPTRRIGAPPPGGPTVLPARRRGGGGVLLAGLAALVLLAVVGFVLLGGDDGGRQGERPPNAERTPEATATATASASPTAEATETATATPEATSTPEATPEGVVAPDLDEAGRLQLQGYNARVDGDYERAIEVSQRALAACGENGPLDPCGYAAFEVGVSLNRLGRPDEAIPFLEQRVSYGDNSKEATKELKDARKAARGKGRDGDDG